MLKSLYLETRPLPTEHRFDQTAQRGAQDCNFWVKQGVGPVIQHGAGSDGDVGCCWTMILWEFCEANSQ